MNELLFYMKAALEGQHGLQVFARWFQENDAALQQLCSRGSYLRLKNENALAEFRIVLRQNKIQFIESPDAYLPREPADYSWIDSDWLTNRLLPYCQSPTSLALVNAVYIDELLHMIDIKQTGDELWRFSSPPSTWEHNMGRAGIALVRNTRIVYAIVTMRN